MGNPVGLPSLDGRKYREGEGHGQKTYAKEFLRRDARTGRGFPAPIGYTLVCLRKGASSLLSLAPFHCALFVHPARRKTWSLPQINSDP